jgi:hypothetical protein
MSVKPDLRDGDGFTKSMEALLLLRDNKYTNCMVAMGEFAKIRPLLAKPE